jgi:hypothetical protein
MVDEEVRLDLQEAFRAVDELVQRLSDAGAAAGRAIAEEVAAALSGVDTTVEIGDTSLITGEIEAAVAAADTEVKIDVDQSALPTDAAIEVDVANPAEITDTVSEAIQSADTSVDVSVDPQSSQALSETGNAALTAAGGLDALAQANIGVRTASAAAVGDVSAAGGAVSGLGGKAAGATGLVLAFTGVLSEMIQEAAGAQAASVQLDNALGPLRAEFEQFNIVGLNEELETLAVRLGSDDDAVRAVVARLAGLGQQAGATQEEIVGTAQQLTVLAARAVALDPSLGSIDSVLERLPIALSRGGRFASTFGINLTQADIAAQALAQGITKPVNELSIYEKTALGAAAATQKLGDRIGSDIDRGASTAVIQLRAFRQEIRESLEDSGGAILGPITAIAQDVQPIITSLAEVIGSVGGAVIAAIGPILNEVGPQLSAVFHTAAIAVKAVIPLIHIVASAFGLLLKPATLLFQQLERLNDLVAEHLPAGFRFLQGIAADVIRTIADFVNSLIGAFNKIPFVGDISKVDTSGLEQWGKAQADVAAGAGELVDEQLAVANAFESTGAAVDEAMAAYARGQNAARGTPEFFREVQRGIDEANAAVLENRGLVDEVFFAYLQLGSDAPSLVDRLTEALARGSLSTEEFAQVASEFGLTFDQLAAVEARVREESVRFGEDVAEAIGSVTESAAKLDDEAKVHIDSFVQGIQEQALAAAAFTNSIEVLFERGATQLAQSLLAAGQDAAGAAAEAAGATDEQLASLESAVTTSQRSYSEQKTALEGFTSDVLKNTSTISEAFGDLAPSEADVENNIDLALLTAQAAVTDNEVNARAAAHGVGSAISDGLAQGIRDGNAAVAAAATAQIDVALLAAQTAAETGSPSRLFSREVGFPITEGIAEGIRSGFFHAESAIDEVIEGIQQQAQSDLDSLFGAISAGRGVLSAQQDLASARQRVEDLQAEQLGLKAQIAQARDAVNLAIAEGAVVTNRELQAIEQAKSRVDEIQADLAFRQSEGPQQLEALKRRAVLESAELARLRGQLAEEQANVRLGTGDADTARTLEGEVRERERSAAEAQRLVDDLTAKLADQRFTTLDLLVAQEDLQRAREDSIAPTREVEELERNLEELYERQAEIGPELAEATDGVTEAQLRLLEAFSRAAQAGQSFFEEGNRGIETLKQIGAQAGLAGREVQNLIDSFAGISHGITGSLGGAGGGAAPFPGAVDLGFTTQSGQRFVSPTEARDIINYIRGQSGEGAITRQEFEQRFGAGATINVFGAADPQATAFAVAQRLGLKGIRG